MRTAYVIVRFRLVDDVPVFKDAGIYGESPLTTTDPPSGTLPAGASGLPTPPQPHSLRSPSSGLPAPPLPHAPSAPSPLGELQSTLFESKGEDFRDAVHNAVLKMRLYPHWRWLLKHIPPEGWTLKLARDPQGGKAG